MVNADGDPIGDLAEFFFEDLDDLEAGPLLAFLGGRAEVGDRRHIRMIDEREILRRLFREHVQSRGPDLAGIEAVEESFFVNDSAPGYVDDDDPVLHLSDLLGAHERPGLFGNVKSDEVGLGQEIVHGNLRYRQLRLDRNEVISKDLHAEGDGAPGYFEADAPAADDSQGFSIKLGAF